MATSPLFVDSVFRDEISGVRTRTLPAAPEGPIALAPVLTDHDVRDLQAFFQDAEGESLACNEPPRAGGVDKDGPYMGTYGCDSGMAALIDSKHVRTARWVRERLLRMDARGQGLSVVVLHLLFGYRPAGTEAAPCENESKAERTRKSEPSVFRDLAPIIHLTEAVEEERHRMGGRMGAARAQRTEDAIAGAERTIAWAAEEVAAIDVALAETEPRLRGNQELPEERVFWASAGQLVVLDGKIDEEADEDARDRLNERRYVRWTALERKMKDALSAIAVAVKPQRRELLRRRQAWLKVSADAETVRAMGDDAADRAIKTSYYAPTRELTAGDVLRARLTYGGPAGDKAAYGEWLVAKNDFVARVRNQAEKLRVEAHRDFANARFA